MYFTLEQWRTPTKKKIDSLTPTVFCKLCQSPISFLCLFFYRTQIYPAQGQDTRVEPVESTTGADQGFVFPTVGSLWPIRSRQRNNAGAPINEKQGADCRYREILASIFHFTFSSLAGHTAIDTQHLQHLNRMTFEETKWLRRYFAMLCMT